MALGSIFWSLLTMHHLYFVFRTKSNRILPRAFDVDPTDYLQIPARFLDFLREYADVTNQHPRGWAYWLYTNDEESDVRERIYNQISNMCRTVRNLDMRPGVERVGDLSVNLLPSNPEELMEERSWGYACVLLQRYPPPRARAEDQKAD